MKSQIVYISDLFKTLLIISTLLIILLVGWIIAVGNLDFSMLMLFVMALPLFILILHSPYWGLVLLVALVPLVQILPDIPILTSLMVVIGGLTLVSFLVQNLLLRKQFHLTSKWLYFAVGLLVIVMLFGQINLQVSIDRNYFFTYFQLAALIFLCDQLLVSKNDVDLLMLAYILAVLISGLFAFSDYLGNLNSFLPYEFRPRGLVGNSNGLGIHLSVSMVMAYYFFRNSEFRLIRFLAVASFVFSGVMLFISGSRGAFLFFIPVILYQFFYDRGGKRLIGVLLILIVVFLVVNFIPVEYLDRMVQIPTALGSASETIGVRLKLWDVAIQLWSQSPVFGIGPGMFYFYTSHNFSLLNRPGLATHNMYITYLTENGIIGLAVYLCVVFLSIALFFKALAWAKRINPSWVALVVTWQSALLIQLLNGTKANGGYDKIQWLCLGMSVVLWRLVQEQVTSQESSSLEQRNVLDSRASVPNIFSKKERLLK